MEAAAMLDQAVDRLYLLQAERVVQAAAMFGLLEEAACTGSNAHPCSFFQRRMTRCYTPNVSNARANKLQASVPASR
eukprot:1317014-Amphidinium_carterae.2